MTRQDLEAAFGQALVRRIGQERYQLWFTHNTKLTWEAGRLTMGVPNRFFQEWLHETFAADLAETAREILGEAAELNFVIDPELFQKARGEQATAEPVVDAPGPPIVSRPETRDSTRRRWLQLDDFVIGACNRMAHAATLHLIEQPETCPAPTLLCGPPGVGKTHLLEGLSVELRKSVGEAAVLFLTAEEFTNQFLQAMRGQLMPDFRKQFRTAQALCVDDIHFLAKKWATQEELLHTFEALRRLGRPVAFTSISSPGELENYLPELRDRLHGGSVWRLEPPDPETRRRLLELKAARAGLLLSNEVLAHLACLRGNFRELEGAMHRLCHKARVHEQPVTMELARSATEGLLESKPRDVAIGDIERALCRTLELDAKHLRRRGRTRAISHPRMLAIYLARQHTAASYAEISLHFGSTNHTTALAAERKVKLWLTTGTHLVLDGRRWAVQDLLDLIERELAIIPDPPRTLASRRRRQ